MFKKIPNPIRADKSGAVAAKNSSSAVSDISSTNGDKVHKDQVGCSQARPPLGEKQDGGQGELIRSEVGNKRQWKAEMYEFFIEHLLSIKNFDRIGLTEQLTWAWFNPEARRLRKSFFRCWGPYGALVNRFTTKDSFFYACILELGVCLIAVSLATLTLRPYMWPLCFLLFVLGGGLITVSKFQIDF
jgi:hypothetical protein